MLYPIGTVNQILVENVGEDKRQVKIGFRPADHVLVQIGGGGIGLFTKRRIFKQLHQAPVQHIGGKRAEFGQVVQILLHQLPHQAGGEAEINVGGDAVFLGQIAVDVAAHALALNDNGFRFKHIL